MCILLAQGRADPHTHSGARDGHQDPGGFRRREVQDQDAGRTAPGTRVRPRPLSSARGRWPSHPRPLHTCPWLCCARTRLTASCFPNVLTNGLTVSTYHLCKAATTLAPEVLLELGIRRVIRGGGSGARDAHQHPEAAVFPSGSVFPPCACCREVPVAASTACSPSVPSARPSRARCLLTAQDSSTLEAFAADTISWPQAVTRRCFPRAYVINASHGLGLGAHSRAPFFEPGPLLPTAPPALTPRAFGRPGPCCVCRDGHLRVSGGPLVRGLVLSLRTPGPSPKPAVVPRVILRSSVCTCAKLTVLISTAYLNKHPSAAEGRYAANADTLHSCLKPPVCST